MFRLVPLGRLLGVVVLSSLFVVLLDATQAQTDRGKKYALLVGVRSYRHSDLENLKDTENDVVELADALKGFTEVVVLTTSAGQKKAEVAPTAKNIRTQLRRLLEKHQWSGITPTKSYGACPECGGSEAPFAEGHQPGCAIAAVLRASS